MATSFPRNAKLAVLSVVATAAAFAAAPSLASPVLTEANTDFSSNPVTFSFDGSSFTFSGTGDYSGPTAVQTANGGEVSSFGGFLGFPVVPSSDFYPERGGDITFGPGSGSFSQFTTATEVPYSNGGNVFGLVATQGASLYYGYALTMDNTLVSYGFENVADATINASAGIQAASAVPENATWLTMIVGFGAIGGTMRRAHRKSEERFTRKVRSLATA